MLSLISSKWWLFVVRGLLAIVLGILAFARPDIALLALVAMFGAFALIDGLFSLLGCFALSGTRFIWWLLLEGLVGIAAGVLTFVAPSAAAFVLLTLFGIWLIVGGVLRVVFAIEMRRLIRDEWLVAISGVCALVAGILTLFSPFHSAIAWMWIMGVYAVAFGLLMLTLGLCLREHSGSGKDAILGA